MRLMAFADARWRPILAAILVAGLLLRVIWALVVPVDPVSDSFAYHTFAVNIVEHGVYGWKPDQPGAYWPVGTSAVIAALYWAFGQDFTPVVVLNIILSVAVIGQVFWLAGSLFDRATGLFAAAIVAFWPSLIMYVTVLASEVLFIFLVLGGLLAFRHRWRNAWIGVLVVGLFWAGATYVRPLALLLPIVFGVLAVLRGAAIGATVARVVGIGLVMAAVIAPWTLRNNAVFGEPVLISTNFGPVFWMGNNPDSDGTYMHLPDRAKGLSEVERGRLLKDEAMAHIRAEPLLFLKRTVARFLEQHNRETIAVHWNGPSVKRLFGETGFTVLKLIATGYWYVVAVLALAGIVVVARRDGLWSLVTHPCLMGWMYFAGVHALIISNDRYHFPAIPFITILAAAALVRLMQRKEDHVPVAP